MGDIALITKVVQFMLQQIIIFLTTFYTRRYLTSILDLTLYQNPKPKPKRDLKPNYSPNSNPLS